MPNEVHGSERLTPGRHWLLIFLMLCATVSTSIGVRNALHQSQDFQWSGERVLLQHVDPWAVYLAGDPKHRFLGTQIPNYLPILYVLIVPFGLLPLLYANVAWALANVIFAVVAAVATSRAFEIERWQTLGLIGLMMMATPTRIAIGNGQQSLLVLMVWCLTLLTARLSVRGAALSGIAYFKYSFAPPMIFFLLFRRGVRAFALSLLPAAAGIVLVWLWLTGGRQPAEMLRLVWEPVGVSRDGFKPDSGDPNLMNVLEQVLHGWPATTVGRVEIATAVVVCVVISFFAFRVHREADVRWQMAVMATMSYALFKHHVYDAVVLLIPLAYAVRHRRKPAAKVVLGSIVYLFFLERVLQASGVGSFWLLPMGFVAVMLTLGFTCRLVPRQPPAH